MACQLRLAQIFIMESQPYRIYELERCSFFACSHCGCWSTKNDDFNWSTLAAPSYATFVYRSKGSHVYDNASSDWYTICHHCLARWTEESRKAQQERAHHARRLGISVEDLPDELADQ